MAGPLGPDLESPSVTVGLWLDRHVELLLDAFAARDPLALFLLRGTGAAKGADDELWAAGLTEDLARSAIAADHSYKSWADAREHADERVDTRFEAGCDAIQAGDVALLRQLLDVSPDLIHQRSPFPHRAMLLHHVAANGIEVERQIKTPPNAVDVMHLLLERGGVADADCTIYGDGQTTMCLLVSSAGPAEAGVMADLVEELCRGGANPNGPKDDGLPLMTAIQFGYTEAAEALARCGARTDNLVFAAALGDLDAVKRLADQPSDQLNLALVYAAGHNRPDVVAYLLTKDPDLTFKDPVFGATAEGYARYVGSIESADLITRHATRR